MAIDAPTLETTERPPIPKIEAINFALPPDALTPYTFGEEITRNNFTGLVIDSFAKARGNMSSQAMYLKYLERSLDIPMNLLIEKFVDSGGYSTLSQAEQTQIRGAFDKVKHHRKTDVVQSDLQEKGFDELLNNELLTQMTILESTGHVAKLGKVLHRIDRFDDSILDLEKPEFLIWLATYGSGFEMIHPLNRRSNNS
jgi:hypothetical protein